MPQLKKTPAKSPAPSAKPALYVGARVIPKGSDSVYEITRVSHDGRPVDLCLRGTNLQRYRVPIDHLTFV